MKVAAALVCLLLTVSATHGVRAQAVAPALSPSAEWAVHAQNRYQVAADVTYLSASGQELKLDVYRRRDVNAPQPTLVFFHGGGWVLGSKDAALPSLLPWLEMGWNVVNVGYRLARVALAPAAVEDALCALRFVAAQAKTYNIDTSRIVVSGESAGGHLALAAAMIPASSGLANICVGGGFAGLEASVPRAAAIINWYGITDLNDMLSGSNGRSYAVQWIGSGHDREDVARRVSPLTYVRAGLPPILSIQGDADQIVPYAQNTRLHAALGKAGVKHELFTVPGGGHGNFSPEERTRIYLKIQEFLKANGL